mgnify:CR=1 FL=1
MTEISKESKKLIVKNIQDYFRENLNQEIGNFEALFLFDFFYDKMGGYFYNQALSDVHTMISDNAESMTERLNELIKPTLDD